MLIAVPTYPDYARAAPPGTAAACLRRPRSSFRSRTVRGRDRRSRPRRRRAGRSGRGRSRPRAAPPRRLRLRPARARCRGPHLRRERAREHACEHRLRRFRGTVGRERRPGLVGAHVFDHDDQAARRAQMRGGRLGDEEAALHGRAQRSSTSDSVTASKRFAVKPAEAPLTTTSSPRLVHGSFHELSAAAAASATSPSRRPAASTCQSSSSSLRTIPAPSLPVPPVTSARVRAP